MTTVETVRGPVDLAELGPTLMHEHIFVLDPEALENYGRVWGASYWDAEVRVADARRPSSSAPSSTMGSSATCRASSPRWPRQASRRAHR